MKIYCILTTYKLSRASFFANSSCFKLFFRRELGSFGNINITIVQKLFIGSGFGAQGRNCQASAACLMIHSIVRRINTKIPVSDRMLETPPQSCSPSLSCSFSVEISVHLLFRGSKPL